MSLPKKDEKRLDPHSIVIVSKYFKDGKDFKNIEETNKMYYGITDLWHENPVPLVTELEEKIFTNTDTITIYEECDLKQIIEKHVEKPQIKVKMLLDNQKKQDLIEALPTEGVEIIEMREAHAEPLTLYMNGDVTDFLENKIKDDKTVTVLNLRDMEVPMLRPELFRDCIYLTALTLPKTTTRIGYKCFLGCENLQKIVLPPQLTYIGPESFERCVKLQTISIPSTVTHLLPYTFDFCVSLQQCSLPGVQIIDQPCFNGCSSLENIYLCPTLRKLPNKCFCRCSRLKEIKIPESVTELGTQCFYGCKSLTNINIPTSVSIIPMGCFEYCGFTSIKIPNTVKSLGDSCFEDCDHLESIILPPDISLGIKCFKDCEKLTSIDLPQKLRYLPPLCFYRCFNLVSVSLPTALIEIGDECFSKCISLRILIGSLQNVRIGNYAFDQCPVNYNSNRMTYETQPNCLRYCRKKHMW